MGQTGLHRETMVPDLYGQAPTPALSSHPEALSGDGGGVGHLCHFLVLVLCCAQEVLDRLTALSKFPDLPEVWS